MDLLSLPDEMCASVMKYLPSDEIIELRKTSIRMDKVAKAYELDRYEVRCINVDIDALCMKENYLRKWKTEFEERLSRASNSTGKKFFTHLVKKHTLTPLADGIDYNICRIDVTLKNTCSGTEESSQPKLFSDCKHIFKRYTDEKNKYEVLDNILRKLRCTETLSINGLGYNDKLDRCLCENKNAFKKTKSVEIRSTFVCNTEDFNRIKCFKKFKSIFCHQFQSNPRFLLEKVFVPNSIAIIEFCIEEIE